MSITAWVSGIFVALMEACKEPYIPFVGFR